jgi:hypothetical protein
MGDGALEALLAFHQVSEGERNNAYATSLQPLEFARENLEEVPALSP